MLQAKLRLSCSYVHLHTCHWLLPVCSLWLCRLFTWPHCNVLNTCGISRLTCRTNCLSGLGLPPGC